ncbi:hypothetical protein AWM70_17245 [Paenibacillus yonginensis]|uniref:Uncharacterized protein n=1 Tax=Paenibacillus yonginensis TaxID=1462996 RepID=A0A1B1N3X8_9BACL|nr:hypothetical protein [Paenibacillus yonginensis]ANS76112.1 hypothetical protein AWM70_17245 [Paenibacillus yonginensis]
MNRVWKITAAVVLIGGGLWAGSLLNRNAEGAGTNVQPGTADDPVVTKSYVDQQIQAALNGKTPTAPTSPSTGSGSGSSADSEAVEVVTVKPGEKLIAKAGAEFIVRVGKAAIYSTDSNGVADLTDGTDIMDGKPVGNNHLLSFPRDGRGIRVQDGVTSSLTVMVRGGYTISK